MFMSTSVNLGAPIIVAERMVTGSKVLEVYLLPKIESAIAKK